MFNREDLWILFGTLQHLQSQCQRGLPFRVLHVKKSLILDKQSCGVATSITRGPMQWCPAVVLPHIYFGSMCNQNFCSYGVVVDHRTKQRGLIINIFGFDVCPICEEQF